MPISRRHNAVFVHIPKTGGQSVSQFLGIEKGSKDCFYKEGLTHLTLPMIEERVDIKGMYIFTFVRNPYTRVASEYVWRMRNRSSAVFNEPTRELLTFSVYMETLLKRWDNIKLTTDHARWREVAHVIPQVTYLDDRINIFRFEKFKAECEILRRMFNIPHSLNHVNRGSVVPNHTERTREITRELYKEDFKAFGYNLD